VQELPPLSLDPRCCRPGCPNPGKFVEIVTGIGTDLHTGAPIRRVRVLCTWHGNGFIRIEEYLELRGAERVRASLLARAEGTLPRDEWTRAFTPEEISGVAKLVADPPPPTGQLKAAAERYKAACAARWPGPGVVKAKPRI
jgi:hypothetical protein